MAQSAAKPKAKTARSYEAIGTPRVDREAGIIRDVCILGPVSIGNNGKVRRKYTAECMKAAASMYEGAMVNIDHPPGHDPNVDREFDKRFGKLVNTHYANDGKIRGDLVVMKTHPCFERVFESASRPELNDVCGLSQAFDYEAELSPAGYENVTKITRVCSVDLVADPATTRSLFESAKQGKPNMDEESTGTGLEQQPLEASPAEGETDSFEGSAFDAVLDEIGKDVLSGKLDEGAAVAKFKLALKLHGPEAKEEKGGETATEGEEEGEECKGEESRGTPATCTHEEAMDVLEAAKVPVTKIRVKALRALESKADREALAATWTKESSTGAKPRSSAGGKPDSTPANPQHAEESKASAWDDPKKAREMLYAR